MKLSKLSIQKWFPIKTQVNWKIYLHYYNIKYKKMKIIYQ